VLNRSFDETDYSLRYESFYMKTNVNKIGSALLAVGICIWSGQVFAQTTTTVTTTNGAFTEYTPGTQTVVVKSETGSAPVRYTLNKQTTIVDESGAPVAIERISPGSPISVQYAGTGERQVASRIVVHRPASAAVTEQETTTTTTRELTHKEKHDLKEAREHPERAAKEAAEKQKDALDKEGDDHH
jgi:hypothetical protein